MIASLAAKLNYARANTKAYKTAEEEYAKELIQVLGETPSWIPAEKLEVKITQTYTVDEERLRQELGPELESLAMIQVFSVDRARLILGEERFKKCKKPKGRPAVYIRERKE